REALFDHARTHYESVSFRVRTRQRPEATGLRGPPGPAAFWTRLRGTRGPQVNLKREGTGGRARPGLDRARARERDRDELGDAPRPRGQADVPTRGKDRFGARARGHETPRGRAPRARRGAGRSRRSAPTSIGLAPGTPSPRPGRAPSPRVRPPRPGPSSPGGGRR